MGSGAEPEGVGEAEAAESDSVSEFSESGAKGREEPRWDRQTPDEDTFCPF